VWPATSSRDLFVRGEQKVSHRLRLDSMKCCEMILDCLGLESSLPGSQYQEGPFHRAFMSVCYEEGLVHPIIMFVCCHMGD
jgi:hypothetical protein